MMFQVYSYLEKYYTSLNGVALLIKLVDASEKIPDLSSSIIVQCLHKSLQPLHICGCDCCGGSEHFV